MGQDSGILSTIFSPEVWMLVFETLHKAEDFNDIESGINASLYFRKVMDIKRTTVLFPLVFAKLAPKYECGVDDAYNEDSKILEESENDNTNDEIVHRREYPAQNASVLKLRMVCHTWNKGVDHFYQNLSYHSKMEHDFDRDDSSEDESDSEESSSLKSFYCDKRAEYKYEGFGEMWSIQQFICKHYTDTVNFEKFFDATHGSIGDSRNPFIGRAIRIKELPYGSGYWNYYSASPTPEDRVFWDTITTILQKYGRYIWYCDLAPRNKFDSLVEYYQTLQKWLSLMPNLKVLDISYPFKMPTPNYPTSRELRQLKREIQSNPLPKLQQLTCLKTYKIPAPIFNELVTKNASVLQMLQASRNKFQDGYEIFSPLVSLSMLKTLSVQFCAENELPLMHKLSVKWNLKTLYIDFDEQAEFIEWSKVFKAAEMINCANTITNLTVNLPVAKTENDKTNLVREAVLYRLNMPFVKRLKLIISNQVSIEFILSMKNTLEILELYFGYRIFDKKSEMEKKAEQAETANPIIKFVGFENRLMESNIWELFPKLKQIYVRNKDSRASYCSCWSGRREKWEKKRNEEHN